MGKALDERVQTSRFVNCLPQIQVVVALEVGLDKIPAVG
jgi:hypothetical protein